MVKDFHGRRKSSEGGLRVLEELGSNLVRNLNIFENDISRLTGIPQGTSGVTFGHQKLTRLQSEQTESLATKNFSDVRRKLMYSDKDFQEEVILRAQTLTISRQEAEMEVILEKILRRLSGIPHASLTTFTESCAERKCLQKAMFYVLRTCRSEFLADNLIRILLNIGANPQAQDSTGNTPLHVAVEKSFPDVCRRLLDQGALSYVKNDSGRMPFTIAIEKVKDDQLVGLLIKHTPKEEVMKVFLKGDNDEDGPQFSIHELMRMDKIKTLIAILDNQIEVHDVNKYSVLDFSLLEIDPLGRLPTDSNYDICADTPYHIIGRERSMPLINHEIVLALTVHKWKKFGCRDFIIRTIFSLITLLVMTISIAIATSTNLTPDPRLFNSRIQHLRLGCEVLSVLSIIAHLLHDIICIVRFRLKYWKEFCNWLDVSSDLILLLVVPLRYTHITAHWYLWSFGYLLWSLKLGRNAIVWKITGSYMYMLQEVIARDIIPFFVIFLAVCVIWTGTFALAICGEGTIHNKNITNSWWRILFTGTRIIVESENVIDEWAGSENYQPGGYFFVGATLMIVYLVICLVIILNLLIAQMSATHSQVYCKELQNLRLNKVWFIRKIEKEWIWRARCFRKRVFLPKKYVEESERSAIIEDDDESRTMQTKIFNQLEILGASMMKVSDRLNHIEARTTVLQDAMRLNSQHLRIVRKKLSRSFGHRSPYLRKFSQKQKKAQTDSAEVRRSPSMNPYHPLDDDLESSPTQEINAGPLAIITRPLERWKYKFSRWGNTNPQFDDDKV